MKMRHLVVGTTAALLAFGALAGGQQHSQSTENAPPQAATDATTIREAQDRLRDAGYPATPQGLREFQQAKGIEPSGQLDADTLAALGVGASAASGASSSEQNKPKG